MVYLVRRSRKGVQAQLDTDPHGSPPTDAGIGSRLLAGSTTGALAVAVAQPTDVVKVRFQAQARAGGSQRYQSTVDAYKTIAREEGFRGLWKGAYQMFLLPLLPPPPSLVSHRHPFLL